MAIKKSSYLSMGLLAAVGLWMFSGSFAHSPDTEQESHAVDNAVQQQMKVAVLDVFAKEITREIVIQGDLQPLRQVELKAQTSSQVVSLPIKKGESLETGQVLISLDTQDRKAQLRRARAEVTAQSHEVSAARKLGQRGLQSENRLKQAESALALAKAELRRAELEMGYISVSAPFSGVLEDRLVELGSHVERGDPLALIVDQSVVKAVGQVSQQAAGDLRLGQTVKVALLNGQTANGEITYISKVGDSQTRSFRVEAEIPNPNAELVAGVSAELRIEVGSATAHFLSPAVLALDRQGKVGVKSVDDTNTVQFYPVDLVKTEAEGIWVSGLPEQVQVISQGQGFVSEGESVIPVPAS